MPAAQNMGRPVSNRHKVPANQWKRWSNTARRVFNRLYDEMRPSYQRIFTHPKMLLLPREQWQTIRWNAAWMAASAVDNQLKPVVRKKHEHSTRQNS